jgi:hypothetical protein
MPPASGSSRPCDVNSRINSSFITPDARNNITSLYRTIEETATSIILATFLTLS